MQPMHPHGDFGQEGGPRTALNRSAPMCQVPGCLTPQLEALRDYHQRYKICEFHLKVGSIMREGELHRFCQQCGRFQPLSAFDENKRSCRQRLARHNARRRRKTSAEAAQPTNSSGGSGGYTASMATTSGGQQWALEHGGGSSGVWGMDVEPAPWGSAPGMSMSAMPPPHHMHSLSVALAARLGQRTLGAASSHHGLQPEMPLLAIEGPPGGGGGDAPGPSTLGLHPGWDLRGGGSMGSPDAQRHPHLQHPSDPLRGLEGAAAWASASHYARSSAFAGVPSYQVAAAPAGADASAAASVGGSTWPQLQLGAPLPLPSFPRRPLSEPIHSQSEGMATLNASLLAQGTETGRLGAGLSLYSMSGAAVNDMLSLPPQPPQQQQQRQQCGGDRSPPGALHAAAGAQGSRQFGGGDFSFASGGGGSDGGPGRSPPAVLPLTASSTDFRNEVLLQAQRRRRDEPVLLAGGQSLDALWHGLAAATHDEEPSGQAVGAWSGGSSGGSGGYQRARRGADVGPSSATLVDTRQAVRATGDAIAAAAAAAGAAAAAAASAAAHGQERRPAPQHGMQQQRQQQHVSLHSDPAPPLSNPQYGTHEGFDDDPVLRMAFKIEHRGSEQ